MSGVLVVAEDSGGALRPSSLELITAARALSEAGAGPVTVALIGAPHLADAVDVQGVDEILIVPTPVGHFAAHVSQAALRTVIAERSPAVVLAGHTVDSLGFAPALAAREGLGFASDVTSVSWTPDGPRAKRGAYGQRLSAELDFPGRPAVVLLLRAGSFEAAEGRGGAARTEFEIPLEGAARTERLELREPPAADVDITKADFLLSVGRGVDDAERLAELEALAQRIGATLSASRPLVDAGWIPSARQGGQGGRTAAPRAHPGPGGSRAVQHVAGMSKARLIIAVNTDPQAQIFNVAHHGAVAALFEVAAELGQRLS